MSQQAALEGTITFEDLYKQYHCTVLRIATKVLRDPSLAEDAAQSTWMRIHRTMDRATQGNPATWICKIGRREALRIKHCSLIKNDAMRLIEQPDAREVDNERADLLDRFIGFDPAQNRVEAAIASLPFQHQDALECHLMDQPVSPWRLHKARAALREALHMPAVAWPEARREAA